MRLNLRGFEPKVPRGAFAFSGNLIATTVKLHAFILNNGRCKFYWCIFGLIKIYRLIYRFNAISKQLIMAFLYDLTFNDFLFVPTFNELSFF